MSLVPDQMLAKECRLAAACGQRILTVATTDPLDIFLIDELQE